MTAAAKANRHPILGLGLALVLACLALPVAAQSVAGSLDAFRSRHGADWSLATDPATSRPRDLRGGAVALGASARTGDRDAVVADVRAFLAEAGPLLGLDPATLALREPGVILASGDFGSVHFDVTSAGVPVEGADVTVAFSRGSILAAHVVGAAPVSASVPATPSIASEQAFTGALAAAGFAARDVAATEPKLAFLPWRGGHALAWRVTLIRPLAGTRHVAWVDARDGGLLSLTDETVSACVAPPAGGLPRRVVAGVRANRADDVERPELLSFVSVGAAQSDGAGLVPPPPAGATATLQGPVVRVECVECAFPAAPLAEMSSQGDLDFGAGGIDASGNGFATPADRSAYFHAERVHRQAARWLAMPWLSQPLTVRTNLPNSCNAYWNGVALNFFRSSPDCANTGEIRDVVSHEWGHGLDENDGLPPPGVSVDAATGEAVGDIVAILRSRDACVGESFFVDPGDWPSTGCSGVRDVDERAPGQRRGVLTASTVAATCPPSAFYRGVAGREGHCEGEILGQAFWHLVRTLSTGTSYGDGSALAAGLGDELAWQVAEALFYRSRSVLASYAPSSMQSIGMSAHEAFLLADDEGDGLASGTPHAWAINDAFVHHGIDEMLPPTSAACALASPSVTTTTVFDASTGRPFVRVSWSDAGPGATRYDVLRDDADGGGLAPIASSLGPGAGSVDDRGVLPDRAARYAVVASGATGCQSVGAASAPAAPALRVAALRVDDSVLGNADARLSAGETADILVDLANDGAADATGVTATLDDVDPGVSILAGGPLAYGRIAAGATVTAPAAFRVSAAAGADSSVTIEVAGEAAEGCLRAIWLLAIARPELVVAARIVDDAAGDADGAWDPGESIDLFVSLTDVGEEAALSVSGALSFRGAPPAGVTITRNAAAWGDIAVAATVPCAAPGFGLAATPAVPRGTLVRLDLALTIAGVPHRVVPVDVLIGGVAEGVIDWQVDMGAIPGFGTGEIVNQEIAIQTSDDDGDGLITGCDVPDVIVETWNVGGTDKIAVLSGDDGRVLQAFPVTPCRSGWSIFQSLAAADIDGDGQTEILTDDNGRTCAFEMDGTLLWKTPAPVWTPEFTPGRCAAAPQIWDLDGDGRAEIIVGRAVLDGPTGSVIYTDVSRRDTGRSLVGDIDLDGAIDIISYHGEMRHGDGTLVGTPFPGFWQHGGIVNLDRDPEAEVVYMAMVDQPAPSLVARDTDGTLLWEWPGEAGHDLRPAPCFGDFDGDGFAETAMPTASEMIMFEEDGTEGWRLATADGSGAAGCSVFDFDSDGRPEILYRDEVALKVIQGSSGVVLWSAPCRAPTHYECPIVLDVDRDGSAEIVIHETPGGNRSTLRAYGNPAWPTARGIWNQEAYAVTHVTEAGVASIDPDPRWLTGNDYRGQAPGCPCSGASVSVSVDLPCDTAVACFDASIVSGVAPFTLEWDFGDGSPPSRDTAPCHDYGSAGTFFGRVTLTDALGCMAVAPFTVVVAEPLVVTVSGEPACAGETCFSAAVTGGTPPFEITWSFDAAAPAPGAVDACHDFAGATWQWAVFVRDARGCLADASDQGPLGAPPASVGPALRVRDHGDPHAAMIDATLDWSLDFGSPRPVGDTFHLLRETAPVGLLQIPGTAGHLPTTYFDSTPAGTSLPHVHYYIVLAEGPCGSISPD